MSITIERIAEKDIQLRFPKMGYVKLSKFSPDFDHGLYKNRPWHIVSFGRNFATVEECLTFLMDVEARWDEEDNYQHMGGGECEAVYLRVE